MRKERQREETEKRREEKRRDKRRERTGDGGPLQLQLLPGMWKCLGVNGRVGVAGREERGELRPLDGSVPPKKKRREK